VACSEELQRNGVEPMQLYENKTRIASRDCKDKLQRLRANPEMSAAKLFSELRISGVRLFAGSSSPQSCAD
jgi:hypothetical protein